MGAAESAVLSYKSLQHQPKTPKVIVPRKDVSDSRLTTRDNWNFEELDIISIFKEFDVDNSGYLEENEFKELLKQYNKGIEPRKEEIMWMLKVADKDHDGKISRRELIFAMQAWHGYTHISERFMVLFTLYDDDHNDYLDADEFRNLLVQLNDGQPVDHDQAEHVLALADQLGDGRLGRYELLGAVGIWYISVGRDPTSEMELTLKAMSDDVAFNYLKLFYFLASGVLTLGFGLAYRNNSCKVDLDGYLVMYGVLQLWLNIPLMCIRYFYQYHARGYGEIKNCLRCIYLFHFVTIVAALALCITGIIGVAQTWNAADRELCGTNLWNASCVLFVAIPCIIPWLFLCIGCISVSLGSLKSNENELNDDTGSYSIALSDGISSPSHVLEDESESFAYSQAFVYAPMVRTPTVTKMSL